MHLPKMRHISAQILGFGFFVEISDQIGMLAAWNEDPLLHLNLHQVIHLLLMTSDYPTPNFKAM